MPTKHKPMHREDCGKLHADITWQIAKLNREFIHHVMDIAVNWDDYDPTDVASILVTMYKDLIWEIEEEFEEEE